MSTPTRHSADISKFRADWSNEQHPLHPSGVMPPDTPLLTHGVAQAEHLASFLSHQQPPITRIYSSPWYRCVQTVESLARSIGVEIIPGPGIGEWYGLNRTGDPEPATPRELHQFYPVNTNHQAIVVPDPSGESMDDLYERSENVLSRIFKGLDYDPDQPEAVLLSTHAATLIALSRVLAGTDPTTPDFTA